MEAKFTIPFDALKITAQHNCRDGSMSYLVETFHRGASMLRFETLWVADGDGVVLRGIQGSCDATMTAA